jgi:uncharacterized protein (DUF1684 family)
MKYLFILLFLSSFTCLGQNYSSQLESYRAKYKSDFLTDQNSPLKQNDLGFLRFYDADSTYRVTATKELLTNQDPFIMPVFVGNGRQYVRYALLKFTLNGKATQLTVYKNLTLSGLADYKDYLFLPFTDETNGVTTYAGGRYIDLDAKDFKGDKVVIDFNKAYNPYCAFSGGYSCPKPPAENHLSLAVEAGEKLFAGEIHH